MSEKDKRKEDWLTRFERRLTERVVAHPWLAFVVCALGIGFFWLFIPKILTGLRAKDWAPEGLDVTVLGAFGDMFGVVGAFVAALALVAVVISVIIQKAEFGLAKDEMKLMRESMQRQNTDSTFYQMLTRHQELVDQTGPVGCKGYWLAPISWSNLSERVFSCLLLDARGFTSAVT